MANQSSRDLKQTIDWRLIICYILLTLVGLASIYASVHSSNPEGFFSLASRSGKQFMWMGIAYVVAIVILFGIKPRMWTTLASPLYLMMLVLLVAVIIFGSDVKGSHSWFTLGPISFQPAELSKITTSLLLADIVSRQSFRFSKPRNLLAVAAIVGIPMLIIILESETGTVMVYLGFLFVLYREGLTGWILAIVGAIIVLFILTLVCPLWVAFVVSAALIIAYYIFARTHGMTSYIAKRQLRFIAFVAAIACTTLILSTNFVFEKVLRDHQRQRIEVLLGMKEDPMGVGYNVNQSMIAIGSGGFSGKGYLQGTQTAYGFVPEQSTDFIFCTIGEEMGFLGCLIVILLYAFLIFRILRDAEDCREPFTRIYGYCVASCIFMHVMINIGMTIGLMPVIGIPLPFVSYGGSSIVAFTTMLFIFVALYRNEKKYF